MKTDNSYTIRTLHTQKRLFFAQNLLFAHKKQRCEGGKSRRSTSFTQHFSV